MASAMLAIPSHAADKAPAPQPEFLAKETTAALGNASGEVQAALAGERNVARQLALYSTFEFSPALRPQLKRIFGTERPFPLERVAPGPKGQINYLGKLAPHTFVEDNGTTVSWTALVAKIATDKAGRSGNLDATWPSLTVSRPGGAMTASDMTMVSRQLRGTDNISYGTATFKVASVSVRETAAGDSKEIVRLEGIQGKSDVARRGKMAEITYGSSIRAIVVGQERVERANFAFRVTNIPAKAMLDLDQTMRAQQGSKLAPDAQREVVLRSLKDFGKRAAVAGASLVIDDISAAYRGNTASIKGRVGFQKVLEADFDSIATLMKKLVARFEVRLPVALVKDIGRALTAKQVDPAAPDASKQIDAGADALVSMVVGKAVSEGYAVIDKNELRSTIEIQGGKLAINGKPVKLPENFNFGIAGKKPVAEPAPERQPEPAAE
jgi:uncharacterized protein YdgA (DUF945 family)